MLNMLAIRETKDFTSIVVAPDNVQCNPTCKLVVKVHRQAEISPRNPTTAIFDDEMNPSFKIACSISLCQSFRYSFTVFLYDSVRC